MGGRTYSPSDETRGLQALAECNGNASEAARVTGYPRTTILYWARTTGVRGPVVTEPGKVEVRKGTKEDMDSAAEDWKRARDLNLAELRNPEKVKKASLYHNVIASGTSQDKYNILTGKPTSRIAFTDLATFLSSGGDEPAALGDGNVIEGELVTAEPKPSVEPETVLQEAPGGTQREGVES